MAAARSTALLEKRAAQPSGRQEEAIEKAVAAKEPEVVHGAPSERLAQWEKKRLAERIELLAAELAALPSERQADLVQGLQEDLVRRNAHPAVIQRLVGKGGTQLMARHEMVSCYAAGAYGPNWNKPTDKELLTVAAARTHEFTRGLWRDHSNETVGAHTCRNPSCPGAFRWPSGF